MTGGRSNANAVQTENKLRKKSAGVGKRAKKAAKDPNKPKRPASAFFVFMEGFRKQYKEEHPDNKSVSAVGKAGGSRWKSMTEEEKAPYVQKADKRKTEYSKSMQAYNLKLAGGTANEEDGDSDKSKSDVNDEDEDEGSGEEEDDD